MQLSAPEALDISKEPKEILELYGLNKARKKYPAEINVDEEIEYFGRKCLVARRLLERGVFLPVIRYPTVARGEARLRITLSAAHSADDVGQLLEVLGDA